MKILIADSLHQRAINGLQSLGLECIEMPELSAEELPAHLIDIDVLIVRSTKIGKEEMENTIFQDGHAASCMLKLDDKPSKDLIHKLRKSEDVIRISLK